MKHASTAFLKAVVLSLFLLLNSGFFAMAAESQVVPANKGKNTLAPTQGPKLLRSQNLPAVTTDDSKDAPSVTQPPKKAPPPQVADEIPASEQAAIDKKRTAETGINTNDVQLTEDGEINVGVKISGHDVDQSLIVFLPTGASYDDMLVPLGELAKVLTLSITVNPGDKKAEGFFVTQDNGFQLDLNTQEVLFKGSKRALKKNEAIPYGDDIYVKASSIKEWFDITLTFDMGQLILDIEPHDELPFQERQKRLENAKKHEKTYTYDAVKPENAELAPYKNFSLPSLYLSNSLGYQKLESGSSFLGFSSIQGNQDIAKFETDYTLSGRANTIDGTDITGARLTFQKRDQLNKLLGPLHAGKVAFGDISFPTVPLFLGGDRGSGVTISSDPRLGTNYANNSDNFTLDGDAPIGYDAELYRNGAFIAFQQIGADGRYSFQNVALTTGFNNFEVVLYGPQGQKTIIKREITRGSRQLRKGELQYDAAAGLPQRDFIPIAQDAQRESTPGASGQIFYGFTDYFTLGTSVYSGPENAPITSLTSPSAARSLDDSLFNESTETSRRSTGAAVSASTSFLGMNLQGQALEADSGRQAYEAAANTNKFGTNFGIIHTAYKNFLDSDQELKDRTEVSAYRSFGGFNMGLIAEKRDFVDQDTETSLEHSISFNFLGISVYNDLIRVFSQNQSDNTFLGELTAAADLPHAIRFRADLLYNVDHDSENGPYRQVAFSAQKNFSGRSSVRAEGIHDFQSDVDTLNGIYSRDFDKFGVDFNVSVNTESNVAFTIGLRHALQPDQDGHYHFIDPKSAGQAALGVRAFIDNNGNGVFDAGDKPIQDVQFRTSISNDIGTTDKNGVTYVSNLSETPLRLKVIAESIPDIYLAPVFDHRDLIPRRGSTPIIDFPFVKMSEIEGYLTYLKQGVEGVLVRLISSADGSEVEKTETDSDGYFIFPAVRGGKYKVSFGFPDKEFMALNVFVDTKVEDPPDTKVEATKELADAAKQAAALKPSASAAAENTKRVLSPAKPMPNIDDPLNEKDLKKLDEKGVERIITQ